MSADKFDDDADELVNPDQHFDSPAAVLETAATMEQKIRILESWERNLRQMMVARSEGMPRGTTRTSDEADLLQQVHATLVKLGRQPHVDHGQTDVTGSSTD